MLSSFINYIVRKINHPDLHTISMKFFTVFNHNFSKYYRLLNQSCNKLGYKLDYEILKEPLEEYYIQLEDGWKSKALHKPTYLLNYIETLPDDELVVYLDADIMLMQRIDEIDTKSYDIGLTYRIKEDYVNSKTEHMKYMEIGNCGVLFIYKNARSIDLLKEWQNKIEVEKNDQLALKESLKTTNAKIEKFDPLIYNFSYFNYFNYTNAKILHFKTSNREFYKNFIL